MPVRTTETEKRLPRLYWKIDIDKGMFSTTYTDEQGKKHTLEANEIEGTLGSVFVINDEGNAKEGIDAHQKVALTIFDDEAIHQIAARSGTNFACSLGSRVVNIPRAARIKLNLRRGTKKKTAFFANIQVLKPSGEWVECEYITFSADKAEKEAQCLKIFEDHPAKSQHKAADAPSDVPQEQ